MKSKYINIAINSEARDNLRTTIAHLHIEWNTITTTDSFRATILEQKKMNENFQMLDLLCLHHFQKS